MTHHISTFDIGVAAGLGRVALDNDARQRYIDTVYSQAIAHEDNRAATGYLSADGYNVIIERNALYSGGVMPSWYGKKTTPHRTGLTAGSFLGVLVFSILTVIPASFVGLILFCWAGSSAGACVVGFDVICVVSMFVSNLRESAKGHSLFGLRGF